MKRLIILLALVAGFCSAGFAEENDSANVSYRTTSGGFGEFGGGFEFQFVKGCAFVTEFGGVQRFLVGGGKTNISNFPNHAPCLTIGYRTFR